MKLKSELWFNILQTNENISFNVVIGYLLTLNYKENNKENTIINFYSWIFYQEINYNNCLPIQWKSFFKYMVNFYTRGSFLI